jgi:hypothetical protein
MVDHKMIIHELVAKLGFDNIKALVKATNPIDRGTITPRRGRRDESQSSQWRAAQ